jgi:hypothetical protein
LAVARSYAAYYLVLAAIAVLAPLVLGALQHPLAGLASRFLAQTVVTPLAASLPLAAAGDAVAGLGSWAAYAAGTALKVLAFPALFAYLSVPAAVGLLGLPGWLSLPLWLLVAANRLGALGRRLQPWAVGRLVGGMSEPVALAAFYYLSLPALSALQLPQQLAAVWLVAAAVYALLAPAALLSGSRSQQLAALGVNLGLWRGKLAALLALLYLLDALALDPRLAPYAQQLRWVALAVAAAATAWVALSTYRVLKFDPAWYSQQVFEKLKPQVRPVGAAAGMAKAVEEFVREGRKEELLVRLAHYTGQLGFSADEVVRALARLIEYKRRELPFWNPETAKREIEEGQAERAELVREAFAQLAKFKPAEGWEGRGGSRRG